MSASSPSSTVTPLRDQTPEEECEALARLLAVSFEVVLVVSDLHLATGRDPVTKVFPRTANFLADDAFRRWLGCFAPGAEQSLLILNGDVFDFLRVVEAPRSAADYERWSERLGRLARPMTPADLKQSVRRSEQEDGLRTDDYKTVWKLLMIAEGHPDFFEALAGWIRDGGRIVVVRGNHDPELHWALVRRGIRDELVGHEAPAADIEARTAFADDPIRLGNLYVEHGHQYEDMTRIEGPPVLKGQPSEINLPLGSFINRYLINKVELLDPFIDNVKPVHQALFAIARRHPIKIFSWYVRGGRFIKKALLKRRFWTATRALLLLAALAVPILTLAVVAVCVVWPEAGQRLIAWGSFLQRRWAQIGGVLGGLLLPVILPYLIGAVREALQDMGILSPREHVIEGARRALQAAWPGGEGPQRRYAVFGHTHVQDVRRLTAEPHEEFYVNTGTWIPLWPLERRDLVGRVIYSFVLFRRQADGEYRHELLEWNDDAGEARAARVVTG